MQNSATVPKMKQFSSAEMLYTNGLHWELSLGKLKACQTAKYQQEFWGWGTSQNLCRKSKGPVKGPWTLARPASPTQETEQGQIGGRH